MANKIKVMINGISGRMGTEVESMLKNGASNNMELIGGVSLESSREELINLLSKSDLVIDFSSPEGSISLANAIKTNNLTNKKILLCTTGFSDLQISDLKSITKSQKCTMLQAPNTSLGILALYKSACGLASSLFDHGFDIEIVETHHSKKIDAPSGTALFLGDGICNATGATQVLGHPINKKRESNTIGMHAIRGGGVYGEHEIRFLSDHEEITISHRALSRSLFARGAIVLSALLAKQTTGFLEYGDLNLSDL